MYIYVMYKKYICTSHLCSYNEIYMYYIDALCFSNASMHDAYIQHVYIIPCVSCTCNETIKQLIPLAS